jgi:DNA-binding transcriptional LysR family regulator
MAIYCCVWHNNPMDRLEAFSIFAAVADGGSFAAAARKLGRSPAAVTRTVAALEADIHTPLFRRTTRVVTLTEAGARFLADVRRILADVEEATAAAAGDHAALRGTLVVTAPVMFGRIYVAPLVLSFLAQHPLISARALLVDRIVDLLEENIDVAVRIAPLADSALRGTRVGWVRRMLCAAPSYLAAHSPLRTPGDLKDHAVIAFAPGGPPRDWSFPRGKQKQRVAVVPRFTTNSTEASIAAALSGHGIVRVLSYQIADELNAGRLVPLLHDFEPPPLPIHVVHTGGHAASARVRAFVDWAVSQLRTDARLGAGASR